MAEMRGASTVTVCLVHGVAIMLGTAAGAVATKNQLSPVGWHCCRSWAAATPGHALWGGGGVDGVVSAFRGHVAV